MRMFDPQRPRGVYGWRKIVHDGKVLGLIPNIRVTPIERDGEGDEDEESVRLELEVFIQVKSNAFRARKREIEVTELGEFYARWIENPEDVLEKFFGYNFEWEEQRAQEPKERAKAQAMSLSDLGL